MLPRTAVLERDAELAALAAAARAAAAGAGSVVLVSGEAGIGKSSLVGELHRELPDARLLTGRCDDLDTPRVLGPFRDRLVALAGARWADAAADAEVGLDATSPIRCTALFVLGRVALRTGAPADELVDECWLLGRGLDELQRTAPAAGLVCEAAWLRGDLERVRRIAREVYDEACRVGPLVWRVEVAHWLRLAGHPVDPADLAACPHPYARSAQGDWRGAAAGWAAAGYPYEAAAALVAGDDQDAVLTGLAELDALGAVPLATRVRDDLRRRGTVRVPRGPTPATRLNVAGLTARQLDVLELLAEGCSNAAIAERLVLSVRTVDHHVAALMAKLAAATRHEAVERATEQGWAVRPPLPRPPARSRPSPPTPGR